VDGYRLDLSSPPDWRPLDRLAGLSRRHRTRRLHADEFLYAGRLVGDQLVTVHLYKQVHSRAYLSIDECGHAYRVRCGKNRIDIALASLAAELSRVLPDLPATPT
jgi:hypothetical protein